MASSSDIRETVRKKRRALQETLKHKHEDDLQALVPSPNLSEDTLESAMKQEPQVGEEDPGETLKGALRAQRQRRRRKLLEQTSARDDDDDGEGVQEIPSVQPHGEDEGSADSVVSWRPPTGSQRGVSSREQQTAGSQLLESSVTRRLQEKLRAARSRGESLQESEASVELSRLQTLRDRDTRTRFDREVDPDGPERPDGPLALSSRVKFREASRRTETGLPTAEEAYNFFTLTFEPGPRDGNEIKGKPRTSEEEEEEEEEEGEEEEEEEGEEGDGDQNEDAPLVRDADEFVIEQSTRDFLETRRAEYLRYGQRVERESRVLFTPSLTPVAAHIKLPDNVKPRYVEDEGLYVGQRPPVSLSNENILENRILQMEEGKKWFGDDGRIVALPDPIKESSTRPPLFHMEEDLDPALHTVYRKPLKSKYATLYLSGAADPEGDYQLDVDVSGLIFSHHPLFSREHVLGSRLAQLYDQYLSRQRNNLSAHLTDKLNGLRNALRGMLVVHGGQSLTAAMQRRISEYSLEVRSTRQLRDGEQEKDRVLLRNIVRVWKELKTLRDFQSFTNTPYKLSLRRESVDRASDEHQCEGEILAELVELEAEMEEDYQRKLAEYKKHLEEWKVWRRKQKAKKKRRRKKKDQTQGETEEEDEDVEASESEGPAEEGPPKPEPPEKPDVVSNERRVREKASRIRRKPGEPVLIPELSASGNITASEVCKRAEACRREDVAKRSLFIKILYNDKEVSRTDSRSLNGDFRVHFGQIFNLKIVNCPQSLNLQVFEEVGSSSSCLLLAQVFVPVPGPSVGSSSVPVEEFEFSSNQRVMFDHEGVGSDVPLSFEADGSKKQTLLTSGKLSCCVSWGVGEDGAALAPRCPCTLLPNTVVWVDSMPSRISVRLDCMT
ncbi:hypothetical protein CesoFtcFv8_005666 [Champsocephalus esox]|uniref:Coiled-coil and C2 domain-containing protein 2A n=1 Tax=Champsocephalus esox TaxID=159716 RepID=A0AAN8CP87_9TELE|nr:hypothetical protein CesoFtcFv8_005666 [Champsocephalus esox]